MLDLGNVADEGWQVGTRERVGSGERREDYIGGRCPGLIWRKSLLPVGVILHVGIASGAPVVRGVLLLLLLQLQLIWFATRTQGPMHCIMALHVAEPARIYLHSSGDILPESAIERTLEGSIGPMQS